MHWRGHLEVIPTGWAVVYPVYVDPIGHVWRRADGWHARLHLEDLGAHATGDSAVERVWARFLEQNATRHEYVSRTHGGDDRHPRRSGSDAC